MSALQKYKKEALVLREENKILRTENEKLRAGLSPIVMPSGNLQGLELDAAFMTAGDKIVKEIRYLVQDFGGIPLAGCYVTDGLLAAYHEGLQEGKHNAIQSVTCGPRNTC